MNRPEDRARATSLAAAAALDGTPVVTAHAHLRDTPDGAPLGVELVSDGDGPAALFMPWGRFGLPSREDVYGPEDAA